MGRAGGYDGRRRCDLGNEVRCGGDRSPAAGPAAPVVRPPSAQDGGGKGNGWVRSSHDGGELVGRPPFPCSVLGPGARPPPRPAAATALARTAVAARGPLPDRIARGHRRPAESAGPSELMEAQVALAHAARAAPWGSRR